MSYDFEQQPRGMSSGAKVAVGCGATAFLLVSLLCGGLIFFGFRVVDMAQDVAADFVEQMEKQIDAYAARFEAEGYQRVTGQVVDINSNITQPTVYTVQVFKLNADSEASIAVMAQAAEINGTINGDLHFYGQALTIHSDSVITGNVHVDMAQVFENHGTVKGEVVRNEAELLEGTEDEEDMAIAEELVPAEVKPSPGDVVNENPAVESSDDKPPANEDEAQATDEAETEVNESQESSEPSESEEE